jgi:hypothetical protein
MKLVRIEGLPDDPLDAAALFLARELEGLRRSSENLLIVFPPADHTHFGWRLATVQSLARNAAPRRVNAIASDDPAAIASALGYLESAPGLTGQYFALDGSGAGDVLG